ncbi:MAG: FG-GAP repeat protein [Nannocystaceae bacterium]
MTPALWLATDRAAVVGDFNGDGYDDLILRPIAASVTSTLLLPGSASGFRSVRTITEAEALGATPWSVARSEITVADYDGDGADDLLLRGVEGMTVIDPLLNPSEMVDATDSTSDQTYVIYLPPQLFL